MLAPSFVHKSTLDRWCGKNNTVTFTSQNISCYQFQAGVDRVFNSSLTWNWTHGQVMWPEHESSMLDYTSTVSHGSIVPAHYFMNYKSWRGDVVISIVAGKQSSSCQLIIHISISPKECTSSCHHISMLEKKNLKNLLLLSSIFLSISFSQHIPIFLHSCGRADVCDKFLHVLVSKKNQLFHFSCARTFEHFPAKLNPWGLIAILFVYY